MNEQTTIELAREGHPEAFHELYERHRMAVYRLAYRYVRSAEDAEDVMQDTFIKAFRGLTRFDASAGSGFSAWLGTICVHCAIEHLRRDKRLSRSGRISLTDMPQEPASADPSPERTIEARRAAAEIENAFLRLSPGEQVVFDLRYRRHMNIKDIAVQVGRSESYVKTLIFRMVGKMRRHMERIWSAS